MQLSRADLCRGAVRLRVAGAAQRHGRRPDASCRESRRVNDPAVDGAIPVPGISVGIVMDGHSYIYNYGQASKVTGGSFANDTLFEIGSVSKTLTATLASYAQNSGRISLSDSASKNLPTLRGSSFDQVSLLNLGTHTAGGYHCRFPSTSRTMMR
jgi:CubicO group peptidase (beta-lactamase class C family)